VVTVFVLFAALAQAPAPTLDAREVAIDITIDSSARAVVRERYTLAKPSATLTLEHLAEPCAVVGPVTVRAEGSGSQASRVRSGRWVTLDATTAVPDARAFEVEYAVQLSGREASIPIVLPTMPLAPNDDRGRRLVSVRVVLPLGTARVTFPRLRHDGGAWSERLIALPSVVRVRLPDDAPCTDRVATAGDGGLGAAFAAFVGTMLLWLPVYFGWVRTRRERA
jgi:hypothetical protein